MANPGSWELWTVNLSDGQVVRDGWLIAIECVSEVQRITGIELSTTQHERREPVEVRKEDGPAIWTALRLQCDTAWIYVHPTLVVEKSDFRQFVGPVPPAWRALIEEALLERLRRKRSTR